MDVETFTIRYVESDGIPRHYKVVNQEFANRLVRALREQNITAEIL